MTTYYAHTLEDSGPKNWERLEDHLGEVAALAESFASHFDAGDWGRLAGLWHDLGKYQPEFQDYLMAANGYEVHLEQKSRVDHSTPGAQWAEKAIPNWGRLLAYVIAGHHAGLTDAAGDPSSLESRLQKETSSIEAAPSEILKRETTLANPPLNFKDPRHAGFQLSLFTRMLFSSLVDADFLATEAFMNRERASFRQAGQFPGWQALQKSLFSTIETKASAAPEGTVKDSRQQVLQACRHAAQERPGFFSLTVPTGGGKTLSSLAFALDHLTAHSLNRVIYAIPFTSIIEQTAQVFRDVFQDVPDVVLEHHSNVDPEDEKESPRSRLAAENWDAPLVVTTNVQLLESLFAARTSRCRKLHNLVGSVIILDEVQTMPVELLRPCLAVLEELVRNYRCSIVLCTATQPALLQRDGFPIGLPSDEVREIIPEPTALFTRMKRVEVRKCGSLTDGELTDRLTKESSFLTIINKRAHAASLYQQLKEQLGDDDGLYHLSTWMCGQHRAEMIREIRDRLSQGEPCRVVSTQLIEAGVDVDFPVVYRAMTGLDSVAQAAGRCNREGKQQRGTVYLFDPVDVKLQGYLYSVAQSAREVAPDFDDLLSSEAIQKYFELHYWKQGGENQWDRTTDKSVMDCFPPDAPLALNFRSAAERFRMIEETGQTIFIPYDKRSTDLIARLRDNGPSRHVLRGLQRYTVTLYDSLFQTMRNDLEELHEQYYALANQSAYDRKLGLRVDNPGNFEPGDTVF